MVNHAKMRGQRPVGVNLVSAVGDLSFHDMDRLMEQANSSMEISSREVHPVCIYIGIVFSISCCRSHPANSPASC